jgi:Uma2 family endonuclease
MAIEIARKAFTADEYERMAAAGVLAEDDRLELIDGEIREMSPIGPYHAAIVSRLNRVLGRQLSDDLVLRVQDPIRLSDYSEPQPDIAVVETRPDDYTSGHPTPEVVRLLIEVSDTTAAYDRAEKLPRYAQAGIPEVWIVDVAAQQIEQHTQPAHGQYRTKQTFEHGQDIRSQAVEGLQAQVDAILG